MFQIDTDLHIYTTVCRVSCISNATVALSIPGVAVLSLTFNELVSQSSYTGWAEYRGGYLGHT